MRLRAIAAIVVLFAVAAAGCSANASGQPSHSQTMRSSASDSPSPTSMLTPTAPASTPLGAGQRIWAAFSERGLSYREWWSQLKPQLSDSAQAVYAYDDPRNIPSMKLAGTPYVSAKPPAQPGFTAEVVVPTDKGSFRLDLERHSKKSPWLLYAIKFPHSVQ